MTDWIVDFLLFALSSGLTSDKYLHFLIYCVIYNGIRLNEFYFTEISINSCVVIGFMERKVLVLKF